jgi:DNA-binding transcriptional ArsR family regulator
MPNDLQIGQQADTEFEPAQQMTISSLETLKVAADPTRLRILEVLTEKPLTVKQVARKLDTSPTKLYYHVNLLEEHGLITVTGSRIVSGIIEKQYRTSAHSLRVSRELLTLSGDQSDEGVDALLSAVFDATRNDVLRGIHSGIIKLDEEDPTQRNAILLRTLTRLTPDRYQEFYDRLKALLIEFDILGDTDTSSKSDENCPAYGLTVALYPFAEPDQAEDDKEDAAQRTLD